MAYKTTLKDVKQMWTLYGTNNYHDFSEKRWACHVAYTDMLCFFINHMTIDAVWNHLIMENEFCNEDSAVCSIILGPFVKSLLKSEPSTHSKKYGPVLSKWKHIVEVILSFSISQI